MYPMRSHSHICLLPWVAFVGFLSVAPSKVVAQAPNCAVVPSGLTVDDLLRAVEIHRSGEAAAAAEAESLTRELGICRAARAPASPVSQPNLGALTTEIAGLLRQLTEARNRMDP
jgi:hypothetical protein